MLSAHGSAPDVIRAAHAGGGYVVDAVCPLVTKVRVKVRAGQGFRIIYVGHEGHEEAVGTMAVAPEAIWRVEDAADVAACPTPPNPPPCWPRPRCPSGTGPAWSTPPASVIPTCGSRAVRPLLRHHQPPGCAPGAGPRCGALVVIGSANSSSTQA